MNFGVILLVHTALDRAAQVARHWAGAGAPVVIHVDAKVPRREFERFSAELSELPGISFSRRHRCEWGKWGIVAATQDAAALMLRSHREIEHVFLASGACLPVRPVADLADYLAEHPGTDFIESVTLQDARWTKGGLDSERFTLFFPFAWKRHRFLFDRFVDLQRLLGLRRTVPGGLVPHVGSQWWCLTRRTLIRILDDPEREAIDRYFRHVWIPDECYFQTLARIHAEHLESRSLTLSKFDHEGRPHIFYDDHLELLRRSNCFVARKIWPRAERLYATFLGPDEPRRGSAPPQHGRVDRIFAKAAERRVRGRPGLYMQSRFPRAGFENGLTAAPYSVYQGFSELFGNWESWLERQTGSTVHGRLFASDRVQFAGGARIFAGCLSDSAAIRDANPQAFLANLIWNTRGQRQVFQFGPRDRQEILDFLAADPNADIAVISGAWSLRLARSNRPFEQLRAEAAELQRKEAEAIARLSSPGTRARVRVWSLAEFLDAPGEVLRAVVDAFGPRPGARLAEAPQMIDVSGLGRFLQQLRNEGLHPHVTGDIGPEDPARADNAAPRVRPRIVGRSDV